MEPGASGSGEAEFLSARLLSYEAEFESPEEFVYEGKYSPREERGAEGTLSEEESRALAAEAIGVEARELKEEYSYEGTEGRRCYSSGELLLCVSSRGLESMSQSRLVSGESIGSDEARQIAEDFLKKLGYESMALCAENTEGSIAAFHFGAEQNGAVQCDDYISVSVALDDGSIYAFDASRYVGPAPELEWNSDEDAALATLPEGVEAGSVRKLIIRSPGGSYLPCWELNCPIREGESMAVYVDAQSGRQCKIEYRAA